MMERNFKKEIQEAASNPIDMADMMAQLVQVSNVRISPNYRVYNHIHVESGWRYTPRWSVYKRTHGVIHRNIVARKCDMRLPTKYRFWPWRVYSPQYVFSRTHVGLGWGVWAGASFRSSPSKYVHGKES